MVARGKRTKINYLVLSTVTRQVVNLVLLHHESYKCSCWVPQQQSWLQSAHPLTQKSPNVARQSKKGFAQEVFQAYSNHNLISFPRNPAEYTPSVFLVQANWLTVLALMVGLYPVSQCCAAKLLHHMGVGISIKCLVPDGNIRSEMSWCLCGQHSTPAATILTNNCSSMGCLLQRLSPRTDPLLLGPLISAHLSMTGRRKFRKNRQQQTLAARTRESQQTLNCCGHK